MGDYQKPENRSRPKRKFLTPNQENLVANGNRERSPSSFDTVIEGVFHCITNLWIKDFALYTATFRALEINRKHIWLCLEVLGFVGRFRGCEDENQTHLSDEKLAGVTQWCKFTNPTFK